MAFVFLGGWLCCCRVQNKIIEEAASKINAYTTGDRNARIECENEGELYKLFHEVNSLVAILNAHAENELQSKQFLKNTISDISHQLKTPLSALMMYQEIIENEPENFETVKEFSLKIGTALKRMEQLIQSMLKITRIDAGSISFEKSNYSIPNIINHAISELTTRADNEKKEAVQIADTYYVTGNHEASLSQYDELKAELENTGVVVLEDKAMQLEYNGDDITLIGLSDPSFTLKGDMFGEVPAMVDTKLRGLIGDKDNYTILLSHRPELFEAYVNCGVDLVLSGHAHGGQFRLPFIGGLVAPNQGLFPKYDAGLYTKGDTNMIVCRGLGNSIIPIRFNNRPEIVLLELIAE